MTRVLKIAAASVLLMLAGGFALAQAPAQPQLPVVNDMTPEQKVEFFRQFGYRFAQEIAKNFDPNDAEAAAFIAAVKAGFDKQAFETVPEEQLIAWQRFIFDERLKRKSQAVLDEAAKEPGAQRTPSGLIYRELTAGTGAQPAPTQTVEVHYKGMLTDGTVFDSSYDRGQTTEFPLNKVIGCWTEGVGMMKEGGKAKLTCPSEIAYGARGRQPKIPPHAVLIFEVELVKVKAAPAAPASQ